MIGRRRRSSARDATATWSDSMPGRVAAPGAPQRYVEIPEIDRWRAAAYELSPSPERGEVLQRVRQYVEALDGAVDEGTGAALDLVIDSWVVQWLAVVDTEYADHCAVIDVHLGQARQWLVEVTRRLDHETDRLARLEKDRDRARARLTGRPEED